MKLDNKKLVELLREAALYIQSEFETMNWAKSDKHAYVTHSELIEAADQLEKQEEADNPTTYTIRIPGMDDPSNYGKTLNFVFDKPRRIEPLVREKYLKLTIDDEVTQVLHRDTAKELVSKVNLLLQAHNERVENG